MHIETEKYLKFQRHAVLKLFKGYFRRFFCADGFGEVIERVTSSNYYIVQLVSTTLKVKRKKTQKCVCFSNFVSVIKCPSLNTPDYAIQSGYGCSGLNSNYSTSCFFSCMLGYESTAGSQKRTCLETRQWSGTELQCKGKRE